MDSWRALAVRLVRSHNRFKRSFFTDFVGMLFPPLNILDQSGIEFRSQTAAIYTHLHVACRGKRTDRTITVVALPVLARCHSREIRKTRENLAATQRGVGPFYIRFDG